VKAECAAALREVDVLLTPTMVNTAPTLDSYNPDAFIKNPTFTGLWNATGLPAMSIPCGAAAASGLPIAMQIVGRPFDEPMVLRVADAYQRLTDWHTRRPDPAVSGVPA
jgi:aspartyl-tRNA(Asn)/glutamyl-tRNA(Gln) amidotransferase subunit A